MAQLADILQQERERDTAEQWGIIHLYKTLERMAKKIQEIDLRNEEKAVRTIDSYLGILSHTASRCITRDFLSKPMAA